MARYRGWRTSFKDVQDINRLLVDAEEAVKEATKAIVEDYAFSWDAVSELMPYIPRINAATKEGLHKEFLTRADFDRFKRYLGRIVKASESKPRKGTVPFSSDVQNQLTSFYYDESGPTESAFMRSEQRLQQVNRNRRAIAELERKGVSMEQATVMKMDEAGNYVPMRDEWGHVVKVWQPSTPKNQQLYQDIIDRQSELAVVTPDSAIGGVVNVFGDMVDVTQRTMHRMTPAAMAQSNLVDTRTALRTENYFYNYQAIIETTLPDEIAAEMGRYINGVLSMSPAEQAEIYELITDYGDDAATIEYLYLDMSGEIPKRLQNILNFWRNRVAPMVDVDVPDDAPEISELTDMLERHGFVPSSAQNLMGEYHRRKNKGTAVAATFDSIRSSLGLINVDKGKKRRKKG